MEFQFQNRVALVTGAASGMALLFCREFVRMGGRVAMVDINPDALAEKAAEINAEYPGCAITAVCDVRHYDEVCAARDAAVAAFGRIDVLVNLAGGAERRMLGKEGDFTEIPIEAYDWSLDVNLRGQFYFDHAVIRQMKEQKSGVIINIGSIAGEEGHDSDVGYATAKSAAMNGLTKSVAQCGAKYGVRCCCVAPGPVLTRPGMAGMKTAMNRAAEPIELVNLLLYVSSDEGSFFDGVNLLMDGGRNILFHK